MHKPAVKTINWASPAMQKRAWSNAWLALLAVPLPENVLRKARTHIHALAHARMKALCVMHESVICSQAHQQVSGSLPHYCHMQHSARMQICSLAG